MRAIDFMAHDPSAVVPGGTRVVASICSTMAGPVKRLPGRSLSRA